MAISGFVGAGVQDALSQQLAEQLRQAMFEEEQRQAQAREAMAAREQTRREAEDVSRADLAERTRRDRNNAVGLEQMGRDRESWETEQRGRQIQQFIGAMPDSPVRRVIELQNIGINGVRPADTLTPDEQAAARQAEIDGAAAKAKAVAEAEAPYKSPPAPRQPSFVQMPDGTVRDVMGVAPPGAKPYQRPVRTELTPVEATTQTRLLRNDFQRAVATTREIRRQADMMAAGMERAKAGDLAAGSQAVLVTFQKILDPTSVVRESEYARSASGQAAMSRLEGAYDRLARGGAGVPLQELQKFADLASDFVAKVGEREESIRQHYTDMATEFGLNPDLVVGRSQPTPGGGGGTPTRRFNPATGKLEPVRE